MLSAGSLISWVILYWDLLLLISPIISMYLVPIVSFCTFSYLLSICYLFSLNIRLYWLQAYPTWPRLYACNEVHL
ncbi:hypothetical protein L211DRAFT_334564 [Terfezia boudieri ATCC MYA-4762]|uniref:Uncharacterized protein n=1 Tax=Terfezia boudieri ATCC MYA-4762 TaxID=1051890 RepID=A0A3N4LNV7_9PEZI|nr:hypothetical protein L211DRAFT_334564 [Terfezia boudieri ATCC MYA-4762]